MKNRKPRICILGCGGTISSFSNDSLDCIDYPDTSQKKSVSEVLRLVPEVDRFADCVTIDYKSVGSTAIGPTDWLALHQIISEKCANDTDIDGFVILHGTATLEETAYFLNLTLKVPINVVLVGAQRPASAVSSDAFMNLISAVRVASCEELRNSGVLVVLNDEIHAARDVAKFSTYRLNTFKSPDFGPIGYVDGDKVAIYRRLVRKHTLDSDFDITGLTVLPRVEIVYAFAGADSIVVNACINAGAEGIISAGLAPGIPPPEQRKALEQAVSAGIVVVQANKGGMGRVARRNYLVQNKMVSADNLNACKARVLLILGLTLSKDPEVIQEFFYTH